jgi:phosphate transport system substrate-binding protein
MRTAIRPWLGALLLAAAVAPAARAQQLTSAGATFPYPIYSKWFDVYHEKSGVAISYQSIGSAPASSR